MYKIITFEDFMKIYDNIGCYDYDNDTHCKVTIGEGCKPENCVWWKRLKTVEVTNG